MPEYELQYGRIAYPTSHSSSEEARQRYFEIQYDFILSHLSESGALDQLDHNDPFYRLKLLLLVVDMMNTQFEHPNKPALRRTITEVHGQPQLHIDIFDATTLQQLCVVQFLVAIRDIESAYQFDLTMTDTQLAPVTRKDAQPSRAIFEPLQTNLHLEESDDEVTYHIDQDAVISQALLAFYTQVAQIFEDRRSYHTPQDSRHTYIVHTAAEEAKAARLATDELPMIVTDAHPQVDTVVTHIQPQLTYDGGDEGYDEHLYSDFQDRGDTYSDIISA